ncbi:placenta-specific gene 8 protein-like [Anneissia japonica]|uniref:placenta-specific gene 8 protein-like n=1 Tax=Anneissia japonica TaxID=1529436 RepID=UPI001425A539|nr:placenta-specific gene 8 protein-like [Anneissia japonica]
MPYINCDLLLAKCSELTEEIPIALIAVSLEVDRICRRKLRGIQVNKQSQWSSGLFDCCHEPGSCLAACFCFTCYPCYLSNRLGESCFTPCCVPGSMVTLRAMKRVEHNIPGSVLCDCCTMLCCPICALTQLKRHHDARSITLM